MHRIELLHWDVSSMIKRIFILWAVTLTLVGCDAFSSETAYSGISVEGFNYMPFNLTRFTIRDEYGNSASGGGDLPPGSGEGSLSCCYKLRGTKFTVDWEIYDQDEFMKDPYAPIKKIKKTALATLVPKEISGGVGEVVVAAHFYPDYHVELELRSDLSGTRIAYDDVWDWMRKNHSDLINPKGEDDSVVFRRVSRLAAQGWVKHGFVNTEDLRQYCYNYLINENFEKNLVVEKILRETKGKPGAFAAEMGKFADERGIKDGRVIEYWGSKE